MEADSSAPETKVPVKVPEPEEHAPPTLAEPASGPVAEMPGSLTGEQAQAEASETSAPAGKPERWMSSSLLMNDYSGLLSTEWYRRRTVGIDRTSQAGRRSRSSSVWRPACIKRLGEASDDFC